MGLFDFFRPQKKSAPQDPTFRCPRCQKDAPIQSAAWCAGFRFCASCGKLSYRELLNSLPQCPACGHHCLHREMQPFSSEMYCSFCAAHLAQRFTVSGNALAETSTGARLERIVIFNWMNRPYTVRGSVPKDAEQFIITLLSDRAEIFWYYTDNECQVPSQQSVTGTEVLPSDYFTTHTKEDFLRFLKEQPWGEVFAWSIDRDERLHALFSRK